tara:strand:- start:157 stop:435 length:279 start_codon:yes stop_codon:yes gene_type:complete
MAPNYQNGDYILITSILKAKKNDLVVCEIEEIGLVLKRVKFINKFKMILIGDNPRQDSSICNIPLEPSLIVGKVIIRLPILRFFPYLPSKNK